MQTVLNGSKKSADNGSVKKKQTNVVPTEGSNETDLHDNHYQPKETSLLSAGTLSTDNTNYVTHSRHFEFMFFLCIDQKSLLISLCNVGDQPLVAELDDIAPRAEAEKCSIRTLPQSTHEENQKKRCSNN